MTTQTPETTLPPATGAEVETIPPSGTEAELRAAAADAVANRNPAIAGHPWRQAFHIEPPTGLLNDPNGLAQHDGTYHVFYQWHPYEAAHKLKFWAHLTSDDLVHWQEQPVALVPDRAYDSQGCYSGSAISHAGQLHLLYTGNVRTPDGGRLPTQCLAVVAADGTVTKDPANPVVGPLAGFSPHVRDPKVWAAEGSYWMVLGAQTLDLFGTVVLLRSDDLRNWEVVGEPAGGPATAEGYMWECPDLIRLGEADVLIISPQYDRGEQAGAERFLDVTRYAVGKLDLSTAIFEHGPLATLDAGPDFYAPQTFVDESGRTILIGWMGKPDQPGQPPLGQKHPTVAMGWVHCLTVPRTLELVGDQLLQSPVPELAALRAGTAEFTDVHIEAGQTKALPEVRGTSLDLELAATLANGATLQLALRTGGPQTTLIEVGQDGSVVLDTRRSGEGVGGTFSGQVVPSQHLDLRVLMDNSSVEVFVNGGRLVFSARIYPGPQATGVRITASGGDVVLNRLACHKMRSPSAGPAPQA